MKRQHLVLTGKMIGGALLIAWLVRSGTLDLGALSVYFERPALLVASLATFLCTQTLGAVRWRVLLRLGGVHLPLGRALQLAFTATFFNVLAPGNIGGDVVKAIYVARDDAPDRRTNVFVVGFLDRFIALAGLVALAGILTLARGRAVWVDPRFRQLAAAVGVLAIVTFVAPILLMVVIRRSGERLEAWTHGTTRLAALGGQLVACARLVSARPRGLLAALGLAIATHLAGIVLFSALTAAITGQDVSIFVMASIYPLGILTMVLPISYAGFGVGHVAFDQLFAMIGLTGGATVLNVYLIGQIIPCLFGVIPYLSLKRQAAPLPDRSAA
jgi:uncharacterized protein (TIRG00374 family)